MKRLSKVGRYYNMIAVIHRHPTTPPVPAWDGTPRNFNMAALGDSIVANGSSPTSGFENYGFIPTANRLSGQRLIWSLARQFGVGGDTSIMAEVRVPAALATDCGVLIVNVGTNDATADMTTEATIVCLKRIRDAAYEAEVVTIFVTPAPRGNNTFTDKRLSGTRLASHLERRTRMLAELPQVGCHVVDNRAILLKGGTENDLIDSYSADGLHPNTNGSSMWAQPLAAKEIELFPAVSLISTVENPWSAGNPTGSASTNLLMAGTTGTPGTGGSGQMATGYTGTNATGTTAATRTYSKIVKDGLNWQQVVIGGGAATSAAALDIMRQISLHTKATPGLTYEVVGEYEIDAGMTNILSLQLGYQITSPTLTETLWDGDRYIEGSTMSPLASAGKFRSPRFVMPPNATDLRMRCSCYLSTAGAPSGTIRVRGLELRPVIA